MAMIAGLPIGEGSPAFSLVGEKGGDFIPQRMGSDSVMVTQSFASSDDCFFSLGTAAELEHGTGVKGREKEGPR